MKFRRIKCLFSFVDFRCAPIQSGVGVVSNCGFSHRRSCPAGQERSPKSAPQHVPTVINHNNRHINTM